MNVFAPGSCDGRYDVIGTGTFEHNDFVPNGGSALLRTSASGGSLYYTPPTSTRRSAPATSRLHHLACSTRSATERTHGVARS
jgi:hypothetical protein